jgi:hypothetical protein
VRRLTIIAFVVGCAPRPISPTPKAAAPAIVDAERVATERPIDRERQRVPKLECRVDADCQDAALGWCAALDGRHQCVYAVCASTVCSSREFPRVTPKAALRYRP